MDPVRREIEVPRLLWVLSCLLAFCGISVPSLGQDRPFLDPQYDVQEISGLEYATGDVFAPDGSVVAEPLFLDLFKPVQKTDP